MKPGAETGPRGPSALMTFYLRLKYNKMPFAPSLTARPTVSLLGAGGEVVSCSIFDSSFTIEAQ